MQKLFSILQKYKRTIVYVLAALAFVGYFYFIDPDNGFRSIIITLQILVISFVAIVMIELLPDIILDPIFGDEKELVENAKKDPQASALVLKAKGLRILAYAIITAGAIIAFTAT